MTAPALPGAAPDPAPGRNDTARLPPEVEEAIREYGEAVAEDARITPPISDPVASIIMPLVALRAAILAATRAATAGSGAASPAAGASARVLGGDGEPVAWLCRSAYDSIGFPCTDEAEAWRECRDRGPEYVVVPLYTRPAATGADIDRAVREAAEQEREAIAAWHDAEADRIRQEIATSLQIMRENAIAFVGLNTSMDHEYAQAETHRECAAVIRARGVAKPRTGSEAPSASDEGAKS